MYQTPPPTPAQPTKRRRKRRSDRRKLTFSFEVVLAAGLAIAVAAGMLAAGGTGRIVEVVVLAAGVGIGFYAGWPVSGHAAVGTAAAYLVLETVFGRLDGSHAASQMLITAGVLGSVLAAGFSRRPEKAGGPAEDEPWADPWAAELASRGRLTAGTLGYEIERARRAERPLSVLAIVPDDLEFLTAGAGDQLPKLLDLVDNAIESTLRAIDIVERIGRARFRVSLPETGPEGARTVAERIRLRIESTRPELTPGKPLGISISIGVGAYPTDGTDEVELEAAAERALARAQALGGNRTVLFSLPPGAPKGWAMSARVDPSSEGSQPDSP